MEIKGRDEAVVVALGWPEFSFCGRCGKPIIAFLRKHKLLQPKTTGWQPHWIAFEPTDPKQLLAGRARGSGTFCTSLQYKYSNHPIRHSSCRSVALFIPNNLMLEGSMIRGVEVKEGQSFQDRTGLAVRVERIDANNRIHFSVIDYREGTSAGPGEMSDFAFVNALQESINALTEELRKAPDVGNIPPRSGVTHARCRFQSPR